jgi:hypothetical protein
MTPTLKFTRLKGLDKGIMMAFPEVKRRRRGFFSEVVQV